MHTVWPLSITHSPRKADILLDTTCFSSGDIDRLSDFGSDTDSDSDSTINSHYPFFDLANPTIMSQKEMQKAEILAEIY